MLTIVESSETLQRLYNFARYREILKDSPICIYQCINNDSNVDYITIYRDKLVVSYFTREMYYIALTNITTIRYNQDNLQLMINVKGKTLFNMPAIRKL